MSHGFLVEAEYKDGYVHRENAEDNSPYVSGKNIFSDILEKRPEAVHGKMVRFTLIGPTDTYSIDWTPLPDNARPIRYFELEREIVPVLREIKVVKVGFGYQYTDENGKNVKEIEVIECEF